MIILVSNKGAWLVGKWFWPAAACLAALFIGCASCQSPDGMAQGEDPADGKVAWTLDDYRLLYRTWRTDEDLKRVHLPYGYSCQKTS